MALITEPEPIKNHVSCSQYFLHKLMDMPSIIRDPTTTVEGPFIRQLLTVAHI